MAGAGFKDFTVGEVLTSADVDTYLMQQSVMRFADSAARGSALGTATGSGTALAEGMVSYLDDLNVVEVYTGSGWRAPGAGIGANVVSAESSTVTSTTSASYVAATNLSVSITPTSATSKILIVATATLSNSGNASTDITYAAVHADASDIGTIGSVCMEGAAVGSYLSFAAEEQSTVLLHAPATTSSVTYDIRIKQEGSSTAYINRRGADTSQTYTSSITAIEVAA